MRDINDNDISNRDMSVDISDPPHIEGHLETLYKYAIDNNYVSIQKMMQTLYPNWMQYECKKFCEDYQHLEKNWHGICKAAKTDPKSIIIVSDIKFDEQHKMTRAFCEVMTKCGYCVRRLNEFQPCSVCRALIPQIDVWHLMKEKRLPVPEEWSEKCKKCV